MKQYPIYEVQKYGVTIEFDRDYRKAEGAFAGASVGGVKLYKLDTSTCIKTLIRVK